MKKKLKKMQRSMEIADALELPPDVFPNIPKIAVIAGKKAVVHNFRGIIEYDDEKVNLSTACGIFSIAGEGLCIKTLTDDEITLDGKVTGFTIK